MRIPKGFIPVLSREIIDELLRKDQIELKSSRDQVLALVEELILEELMVEDRLNQEVREMLKQYDAEIEKGRLDFRRLFDMTKKKIVKDRNIVL
ncbi:MAG: DUF507 family protein [Nitrospirota bacterium]